MMTLPESDNQTTTWRGSGWITGGAAVRASVYPVQGEREDARTGERVQFDILNPSEVPGPFGRNYLRQEVQMRVRASDRRVADLAREALSDIADAVSFGAACSMTLSIEDFTDAPEGVTGGDYRTVYALTRLPAVSGPLTVSAEFLQHLATNAGDTDSDRGRRLTRALRWLRRSFAAPDEFGEFAALVFGYESLTSLLPDPPSERIQAGPRTKRGTDKRKRPDSSEKLRHWAVQHAKIKPEDWTRVGRLRHSLFHGGLTEDAETSVSTVQAIPFLRLALTAALKTLLNLPADAAPPLQLPPLVIAGAQVTITGVVRTETPPSRADEA